MGHQTHIKECDKCKGITITTKVFGKLVIDTNCKCNTICLFYNGILNEPNYKCEKCGKFEWEH
jgi:hypothetical protein